MCGLCDLEPGTAQSLAIDAEFGQPTPRAAILVVSEIRGGGYELLSIRGTRAEATHRPLASAARANMSGIIGRCLGTSWVWRDRRIWCSQSTRIGRRRWNGQTNLSPVKRMSKLAIPVRFRTGEAPLITRCTTVPDDFMTSCSLPSKIRPCSGG